MGEAVAALRLRRGRGMLRGDPDARRQRGDGAAASGGARGRRRGWSRWKRCWNTASACGAAASSPTCGTLTKLSRCPRCGPARARPAGRDEPRASRVAAGRLRLRRRRMIRERADVAILGAGLRRQHPGDGAAAARPDAWSWSSTARIRASPSANPRRRWPTSCWNHWPRNTTCRAWCRWRNTAAGNAPIRIWFVA